MNISPLVSNPLNGLSMRVPPANLQAEQALLGALLANNKAYVRVCDFLKPEHFADPWHGRIYSAIQRRIENGEIADVVTLRAQFENEVVDIASADENGFATTRSVLAPYYLAQLLTSMVGIINAGEYGRAIYDCWLRRELIDIGEVLVNKAFKMPGADPRDADTDEDGASIATDMAATLLDLSNPEQAGGTVTLQDAVTQALQAAEEAAQGKRKKGIPSGLPKLDRMTGGLRAPQLVVVGARPGMGKTLFGGALALAAARQFGDPDEYGEVQPLGTVAIFSMEMGADELGERFLANLSGVSGTAIRDGTLTQRDWDALVGAKNEMAKLPLVIDDRPALTLSQIRVRCRSIAARQKLSMVVVDYLGLMGVPPDAARHGPTHAIEVNTQGLKRLAKELRVPVVALCQLSRSLESREDKRPNLSDLRQSGAIEQDADMVIFLYRDEYYLEASEPKMKPDESQGEFDARHLAWKVALDRTKGRLEAIVAKQRRGPKGTVHLRFDGATSRIWQEGDGDE